MLLANNVKGYDLTGGAEILQVVLKLIIMRCNIFDQFTTEKSYYAENEMPITQITSQIK